MMKMAKSQIKKKFKKFIERNGEKMVRDLVYKEMIQMAHAANMPDAFIKGIKFKKISKTRFRIYNDWKGPFNEPFAKWFEYGTKKNYPITPKVQHPKAFRRVTRDQERIEHGDGTVVQHPSVLHWVKDGKHFFADEVIHPGIHGNKPMNTGFNIGKKKITDIVNKKIQQFSQSNPKYKTEVK